MKKRLMRLIAAAMMVCMMAGSMLTANAKEIAGATYLGIDFMDSPVAATTPAALARTMTNAQVKATFPVHCVTPGGLNIYGWYYDDMNTGRMLPDIPAVYVKAIDETGVTNEMSDYEKCIAIINYLTPRMRYDRQATDMAIINSINNNMPVPGLSGNGKIYSWKLGEFSLLTGVGTCQSFSDAFLNMTGMLGIPCNTVKANSLDHAWNEVYIDGVTYYVDITAAVSSGNPAAAISPVLWADHQALDLAYWYGDQSW